MLKNFGQVLIDRNFPPLLALVQNPGEVTYNLQQRLLPILHYSLEPGGILFLGTSETVGSMHTSPNMESESVRSTPFLYQKIHDFLHGNLYFSNIFCDIIKKDP